MCELPDEPRWAHVDAGRIMQARGIPGIGLGLATAQAVAVLHEGVLSATSTLGQGSSFRLRLPIVRPAAP